MANFASTGWRYRMKYFSSLVFLLTRITSQINGFDHFPKNFHLSILFKDCTKPAASPAMLVLRGKEPHPSESGISHSSHQFVSLRHLCRLVLG